MAIKEHPLAGQGGGKLFKQLIVKPLTVSIEPVVCHQEAADINLIGRQRLKSKLVDLGKLIVAGLLASVGSIGTWVKAQFDALGTDLGA